MLGKKSHGSLRLWSTYWNKCGFIPLKKHHMSNEFVNFKSVWHIGVVVTIWKYRQKNLCLLCVVCRNLSYCGNRDVTTFIFSECGRISGISTHSKRAWARVGRTTCSLARGELDRRDSSPGSKFTTTHFHIFTHFREFSVILRRFWDL